MKKPKILIVDDEERNLRFLDIALSGFGYSVFLARDGLEALNQVAVVKPDLVLLDILMPCLNGFEVCRKIKSNEDTRNIPVIIVTSLDSKDDRLKGLESGADEFLTKPLDLLELQVRVKSILRAKEYNDRLKEAYRSILNITDYSEMILNNFEPLYFDKHIEDEILMNVLRRSDTDYERPASIMLCKVEDDIARCIVYRPGSRLEKFLHKEKLAIPSAGLKLFMKRHFFNTDDKDCIIQSLIPADILKATSEVKNFVSYNADRILLVAFNFLKRVNQFDVQVIKNLVVNTNFLLALATLTKELEESFLYTIGTLARAAEANDEDTGNHIIRVNEYSRILAVHLGLPDQLVEVIGYSAQMHDVGKVHIHPDILRKPGPLTPGEFATMQQHTIFGRNILGESPRLAVAAGIAIAHHECWDGSGYPYGLKGEEINLPARIVQIADVYDALRSQRIYKAAYDHEKAVKIILEGDDKTRTEHFDPLILKTFKEKEYILKEIYSRFID